MPHTPGPWRRLATPVTVAGFPIMAPGLLLIAAATPGNAEANARLIAKAPEMRALLEECMTYLQERPIRDAVRALLAETE